AIDGNPDTAWETGSFSDPRGQWWQVTFTTSLTTDHVTLVQPQRGDNNQWITEVTLQFDGRRPLRTSLGAASRAPGGQELTFPTRRFRTLRITIDDTNLPAARAESGGASPVGFAEVSVAGVRATEIISMPQDLLRAVGQGAREHRLTIVMTRQRVAPVPPRSDPESSLNRMFWLPGARTFSMTGTARIDTLIPDDSIDELMGRPGSNGSGVVAYSRGRLPGDLHDTASAALDGDLATMWSPGLGAAHQVGQWLSVHLPRPITFDHMDLEVVADGRHSVPTRLGIATEHGSVTVALPPIVDGTTPGYTRSVPLHFAPLTGRQITVTILGARLERTSDYYSGTSIALPLGIAELGIPGVRAPPLPAAMPAPCRSDLLTVDGRPVPLRVTGSTADALNGDGLALSLCGSAAGGLSLGPGTHTVASALGHVTGIDIDQLVLDSAPGGVAQAGDTSGVVAAPVRPTTPTVTVVSRTTTAIHLRITQVTGTFWLVLGESLNAGWQATVGGGSSLGPSQLVDGFANGWLVRTPGATAGAPRTLSVTVRWTPQEPVDVALAVSLGAGAVCLVLALWPRRRWVRRARHAPAPVGAVAENDPELGSPRLVSPLISAGAAPPWPLALVVAAASA
ncbi:MAG: discoidin domain-containing protein, partial [Acidimicrobiales bacterium]